MISFIRIWLFFFYDIFPSTKPWDFTICKSTKIRIEQRVLMPVGPPREFHLLFIYPYSILQASQVALVVKNPPANAGDARDLGWEDPLEEGMATHSSILAWRISWTEEPGGYSP